ncbi:Dyp-type peroxidase [Merismopedia glauca]|uniref:Peroxidase n=1 Tax=Merismopedia glauca CCAP 1448/3 TaxID=1296344 RepID=A0A2T1C897_9CYAN|nr:Dyp-type peroxidase domain-containing protein [Merismopedia glauca]PSB04495.1 peroxidase [Merismopedia glauca CCAP 1448/3]
MPKLQEGIYYDRGQKPAQCFSIIFLRAQTDATAPQVAELFGKLWQTYQDLKRGVVADLPGVELPPSGLTVLVGYGPKAFSLPQANRTLPQALQARNQFRSSLQGGGNPILVGSQLRYLQGLSKNLATEEIAVQFIGDTPLSVNRPILETWKILQDNTDPATGTATLSLSGIFTGFNREDGRSWIDFHDGISNLKSGNPRLQVVEIKPQTAGGDDWTIGGTYLTFLRLQVDLPVWRKLSRLDQELLVGRDKLTGCPITSLNPAGNPISETGCPFVGTKDILASGNEDFREPPQAVSDQIKQSHVQRANQLKSGNLSDPDSLRIFRQGYEFLETSANGWSFGLNFVSFQDTPARVIQMLSRTSWLKDVNFGGDPNTQPPGTSGLLSVEAAGIYLVPPVVETEKFPGESIFLRATNS